MQTSKLTEKPVAEVLSAIAALDLTSVKIRLMDPKVGEGWTREYADRIEVAFKHYLSMAVKYQEHAEDILLSEDVDEFWHAYILQTIKYADDCQAVFGTFLHHSPHIGELTQADHDKRDALAEKTRALYQREFGSLADAAWAGHIDQGDAAVSNIAIRGSDAAVSNIAIRGSDSAVSNIAIRGRDAAVSNIAIRGSDAAVSNIAIRGSDAAVSNIAIRGRDAAVSNIAIRGSNAAVSNIAIRGSDAAVSNIAIRGSNAAVSNIAIRASDAAVSNIAIRGSNAAVSNIAIRRDRDVELSA